MSKLSIAILGAGNMGGSLLGGLIADHYAPEKLWITDTDSEKLSHFKKQFQVNTTSNNLAAIQACDVVVFAVKPQIFPAVAKELSETIQQKKPLVISIAAGVRETRIQQYLGGNCAIVRAMPNTPALIRSGASALFANTFVSENQRSLAESILRAVSVVVWVQDEKLMDIITALSGSGPAYFFLIIEALQDAAVKLGLPQEMARLLTQQTAYGSCRMALESDIDMVELRRRVTSPGGTTEKAMQVLEEHNIRAILHEALAAAKKRSEELAE